MKNLKMLKIPLFLHLFNAVFVEMSSFVTIYTVLASKEKTFSIYI